MTKSVEIALVGKYTSQQDTYTSIVKSLEHAGLESNRRVVIKVKFFELIFIINFFSLYQSQLKKKLLSILTRPIWKKIMKNMIQSNTTKHGKLYAKPSKFKTEF